MRRHPILHLQPGYTLEFTSVIRYQYGPNGPSMRCDQQVVCTNRSTHTFQLGTDVAVMFGRIFRPVAHPRKSQKALQCSLATFPLT